ncbi:MAG: nucleotidyltransferase family protein [Rhodospirillum sp.]|nr:nucleotidyltransferase family protein [Rhodospirillum sp.]MCF8489121.1 nucleotidyltransferase family protein [Rhodospirillum sp.]MCF8498911.1 nucleotidyltransferase family protein [Rhodospirillum sp.]
MPWRQNLLSMNATIQEAAKTLQNTKLKLLIVVDSEDRLKGTITDGDIRRGIIRGLEMTSPVTEIMTTTPFKTHPGDDPEALAALMRREECLHVPVVDEHDRVVGMESLLNLKGHAVVSGSDLPVLLLAGGLGTRLMPLTENCPKPMLRVAGRPILQIILEQFIKHGFGRFFISVNYLADQVSDHFGDGSAWGVSIEYLREDKPMGTAGPLSLLPDLGNMPLVMMNGDLLTQVNFNDMLSFHREHKSLVTVGVRKYDFTVPFGIVETEGHRIHGIVEKPTYSFFVNGGIYVVSPEFIKSVPRIAPSDMPDRIGDAMNTERGVHAFPIHEYWLDIGRRDDFDLAQEEYEIKFL